MDHSFSSILSLDNAIDWTTEPAIQDSVDDYDAQIRTQITLSSLTRTFEYGFLPSDLVIFTADGSHFSVHKQVLLTKSTNRFADMLAGHPECISLVVTEEFSIFNLVIHALYELDPVDYKPQVDHLTGMLAALTKYGVSVNDLVSRGTYINDITLKTAIPYPLDTFSVVCQHQLEPLAVKISQRLTSIPLYNLSDQHCLMMGPLYLRRLVFLHLGRTERLKIILKASLKGHPPTAKCDVVDQRRFLFASWHEAVHEICDEIGPATPVALIKSTLSPIVDKLRCAECKTAAREGIRKLILDWAMVKSTI